MPYITHFVSMELEYEKKGNHVFLLSSISNDGKADFNKDFTALLCTMYEKSPHFIHNVRSLLLRQHCENVIYCYRFSFSLFSLHVCMIYVEVSYDFYSAIFEHKYVYLYLNSETFARKFKQHFDKR
jgi:hypothetical protein